jgi:hypothetical protein
LLKVHSVDTMLSEPHIAIRYAEADVAADTNRRDLMTSSDFVENPRRYR